jgi:hypothetical protein
VSRDETGKVLKLRNIFKNLKLQINLHMDKKSLVQKNISINVSISWRFLLLFPTYLKNRDSKICAFFIWRTGMSLSSSGCMSQCYNSLYFLFKRAISFFKCCAMLTCKNKRKNLFHGFYGISGFNSMHELILFTILYMKKFFHKLNPLLLWCL